MFSQSEKLREEILSLEDLDVAAFKAKDIRQALGVPLEVCRLCFESIMLCPPLIKKGNVNLISDVAVAAILLESGFTSAYFNVEINLKSLKEDKKFVRQIRKELKQKAKIIKKIRLQTEDKVGKVIRR